MDLDSAGNSGVTVLGDPGIPGSLTLRVDGTSNPIVYHTGSNNIQYHGQWYSTDHQGGGTFSHQFTGSGTTKNYFLDGLNMDANGESNTRIETEQSIYRKNHPNSNEKNIKKQQFF